MHGHQRNNALWKLSGSRRCARAQQRGALLVRHRE